MPRLRDSGNRQDPIAYLREPSNDDPADRHTSSGHGGYSGFGIIEDENVARLQREARRAEETEWRAKCGPVKRYFVDPETLK